MKRVELIFHSCFGDKLAKWKQSDHKLGRQDAVNNKQQNIYKAATFNFLQEL